MTRIRIVTRKNKTYTVIAARLMDSWTNIIDPTEIQDRITNLLDGGVFIVEAIGDDGTAIIIPGREVRQIAWIRSPGGGE